MVSFLLISSRFLYLNDTQPAVVYASLEVSSHTVDEDSGEVEVCVALTAGEIDGVTGVVQLSTQSVTASESGERFRRSSFTSSVTVLLLLPCTADYTALDIQLTFEVVSRQCVNVSITDDDITEPEETFSVTLVPVSDFVTIRGISNSSVVIEDDDCESHWWSNVLLLYSILSTAVSVSMFVLDDEFDEEDGAGIVCVILSEGQLDGITATVALSTSDDTATSPSESIIDLIFPTHSILTLFHS